MFCAGINRQGKVNVASRRRGAILVLTALLLVFLVTLVAFTIDIGHMLTVRSEAKRATDSAALAGAGALIDGADTATVEAFEFLNRNPVGNKIYAKDEDWFAQLQSDGKDYVASKDEDIAIETGHWDSDATPPPLGEPDTRFSASDNLPSAIRVEAVQTGVPSLFGTMFSGSGTFTVASESIAGYQPRDIVVVLDFSGSMNDDSELKRITSTDDSDREPVENNLQEIWDDLGPPSYGTLGFEPQYVTLTKNYPYGGPEVSVTLKGDRVSVTSTEKIKKVTLQYDNGSQASYNSNSKTGDFPPTGHPSYRYVKYAWVKSDNKTEKFDFEQSDIKAALGLNGVSYPYPSGSWSDYVNYVQTSSNVRNAGYKNGFGGMTLANYWLEKKPSYSQTPDLWQVRAQPVQAVKDAVDVFMEYIQEIDSDDQVSLVVYNSPDQHAKLEHSLTSDFDAVINTAKHRQAAHYNAMTNIGAGINIACEELNDNSRPGAFKMIVLMTDGQANTSSDPWLNGTQYALSEAQKAAEDGYPIVTISLGNSADTNLMQQIADDTDGAHFNVPGLGSGVTNYRDGLLETFREIADDRPLLLMK